jgi:outer membrane scaffolding protein for murein synthesis (MipA/OmpV family)
VLFAGPSITFADRRYLQRAIGVSQSQASASGYAVFDAHAGTEAIGLGLSATRFITPRWLVNVDAAINRLCGSARESPITQQETQHVLALSVIYGW